MLVALAATCSRADMPSLGWIGYLSTVGVYGDHGGAWVDETSELPAGVAPLGACASRPNRNGCALGREARRLPVAVLRLSGIYGPGRNAFVNLANGTARRLVKPGQVFNRIHVADIAGALWHLAAARPGGVFNVTDDEPAPPQDVVAYAAELMGVAAAAGNRLSRPPNFRPWRGPSTARTSASPMPGYQGRPATPSSFPDYRSGARAACGPKDDWRRRTARRTRRSPIKRS